MERLDAATRRVLLKRLEERLEDLQQLVHAIDWEREGKRLLVRRRELTDWFQDDFAEELASCRGPAPLENAPIAEVSDARGGLWKMAALGVLLAGGGVALWSPWRPGPSSRSPAAGHPQRVGGAAAVGGAMEAVTSEELASAEPALRALAERWRLAERQAALPELAEAVANKLESDLVLNPTQNQNQLSVEQRLPAVVGALASKVLRRSAARTTFQQQLEDAGFQRRLLSVYGGDGPDYGAPLRSLVAPDDYDRQAQLRALFVLCPGKSKQEVRQFRQLIEAARRLTLDAATAEPLQDDTELVQRLHNAARAAGTLHWPAHYAGSSESMAVAILDLEDAAAASVFLRWLADITSTDTAGVDEQTLLAAFHQFTREKRDFLELLSAQTPPGKRIHAIRTAQLLLQLASNPQYAQ